MLAGGAGRRFGGAPKGLERIGRERIVDRVARALRAVTSELLLAANNEAAPSWLPGVAVVADRIPDAGGLAGVEAALGRDTDVVVLAWDMPFVPTTVLELIVREARAHAADVVVPESISPFGFEPFCAFYSATVAAPLTAFLERGGRAPRDFIAELSRARRIPLTVIEALGDPRRMFLSVNTAEDLAAARAAAERPS